MKIAYFDCFSGISGNMILGAFISAGLDLEEFKEKLKSLAISGYEIELKEVTKQGINAKYVNVQLLEKQAHRNLEDITEIINKSEFDEKTKTLALKIFRRLAEAEARVHGTTIDKVQFHEVGAVDAIIDILGAAYGFITLEIEKLYFSPLHVGGGMIKCAHGMIPVPAPATVELLANTLTYGGEIKKELVTPTGAAIITSLGENIRNQPLLKIKNVFYGAGTWDLEIPNVLRLVLAEEQEQVANSLLDQDYNDKKAENQVLILETNIDDMSPEIYSYLMERLYDQGALEVYWTAVQMKKNRPGVLLTVICASKDKKELINIILRETTSLGIRIKTAERSTLIRKEEKITTDYGQVRIKISQLEGEIITIKPEYEDCKMIALREGLPFKKIWQNAYEWASKKYI